MGDIADARAAVKEDPENANAHYNLGLLLMKSIEPPLRSGALDATQTKIAAEIEACYLKALELADNHGRAHIMYGMLLRFAKRFDEAVPHLKRGLELPPDSQDWSIAANTLAAVYMEQERHELAVPILEDAAKHHEGDPLIWWKLGASLYFLKRLADAERALLTGLGHCPGDPRLAQSLNEVRQAMGASAPQPAIPKEYADKQQQVEAWAKELQEECMNLFQGPGSQEEKTKKMQAMQAEFQAKVQKLYQP
jgi:tetratricopeptide (TPR) repeat protein